MAVKWTENQKNAINATNGSLLISAAAGSGKTAVLVERVIQRITDENNPVDADKLLIVTYTRAAAAEMKERITKKLEELSRQNPFNMHIRRQQLLLNKAYISTIHSFCRELIKENFYLLDVSPDYRMADETELKLLQDEAVQSVIDELYENAAPGFYSFADSFSSSKSDRMLQQIILRLYTFLTSHPFPESWLASKEKMYDCSTPVKETLWGIVIDNHVNEAADFCEELAQDNLNRYLQKPEIGPKLQPLLENDLAFVQTLKKKLSSGKWDDISKFIFTFDKGRFSADKEYTADSTKLKIQSSREILKNTISKLQEIYTFSEEDCKEDIAALSPLVHYIFKAVRMFGKRYRELKKEKNIADFNDLEHWTLKLLVEETDTGCKFTPNAESISKRFAEVMVDEYQDANEIQDLIFTAVSGGGKNLFVVGDVKQSIYGFRQAMPDIFIRRKEASPLYNPALDNYPSKIILDKNFRSRKGVTNAVNFVFRHLMSKNVGGIEYNGEEKLTPGASYEESDTPDMYFHILDSSQFEEENSNILEARYIAKIIKENVNKYIVNDKGNERTARFGDFCILLRSASNTANDYVNELINCGIPASSEATAGFLSAYEIMVTLNFLRIIDNPLQDIPMLSVMLSPIGGFTEDEAAKIRTEKRKGALYLALKDYAKRDKKTKEFIELLTKLRSISVTVEVSSLLNTIFNLTAFTSVVQSSPGGDIKLNNLRLLLEYVKSFEKSGYRGLSSFVRFIDRLEEQGCDLTAGTGSADDEDCVKVMTIHHSKGLEFPFCFIASAAKPLKSDKSDEILLHRELGIATKRKNPLNNCRYNTMPRMAVSLEIERENMSEELRVLYVAMTRAREKLYVIASHKNPEKYLSEVGATVMENGSISPYIVRGAGSFSKWLTQCALLHPNGDEIRLSANMSVFECEEDETPWDIKIIDDIPMIAANDAISNVENANEHKNVDIDAVIKRFTKQYKDIPLTEIPVKVAASDLAHSEIKNEFAFKSRPAFLQEKNMTGAQKGTAMHAFMQFADYGAYIQDESKELERLVNVGCLTKSQINALDGDIIKSCLNSSIMKRLICAEKTYREYRFTVKIKAGLAKKELKPPYCDEEILLQGAVDNAFVENGSIVIVDYKTDKVKTADELAERYLTQLALYKNAMEQCTGLSVSECVIYSFALGTEIKIEV